MRHHAKVDEEYAKRFYANRKPYVARSTFNLTINHFGDYRCIERHNHEMIQTDAPSTNQLCFMGGERSAIEGEMIRKFAYRTRLTFRFVTFEGKYYLN